MTIRNFILAILFLVLSESTYSQDGSDIIYLKLNQLDKSYIGDTVQIDFYRRSFGGLKIDTVQLVVENIYLKFKEHRVDDGYNNWFRGQYLESIEKINGYIIRVRKLVLKSFTSNSTNFILYFDFYTDKSKNTPVKTESIDVGFANEMIAEILVSAESHNKKLKN